VPQVQRRRSASYLWPVAVVVILATSARLCFWLWTQWTIEDALIIARMVRNLTEHGEFTFNLGQRVSASTSPLFAVMTAAISSLGIDPVVSAKCLGVAASTATCVVVFDLLAEFYPPRAAVAGSLLYALLPPSVAYAVGGMETPVYTLACAMALERLLRSRSTQAAVWAAIAALLRPDGLVVLMVVGSVVAWRHRRDRRQLVRAAVPSALILAAGVATHAWYFGTLVPHSLIAKGIGYQIDPWTNTLRYLSKMLFAQPGAVGVYLVAAIGIWRACGRNRAFWIPVAWYLVYHVSFFLRAPLFDWYLQPPLWALGLFAGFGAVEMVVWLSARIGFERHQSVVWLGTNAVMVVALGLATMLFGRSRLTSQYYEDAVRAKAGQWLALHTSPTDVVFTESLGYIGYQTGNPFVDWPGLASPGVPELLRTTHTAQSRRAAFDAIISAYRPSYLVLRDTEWRVLAETLKREYELCATFEVPEGRQTPYFVAGRECR